jgi:hypothetical protein
LAAASAARRKENGHDIMYCTGGYRGHQVHSQRREDAMTFIDELLEEAEVAEQDRKRELDTLLADQFLMAIGKLDGQMAEVNDLVEKEIKLLEEYRSTELTRLDKKRSWLTFNLDAFMRSTGEKTVRLPHGIPKLRKGRDRVAVVAMDAFLKVGQKLGLIRTIPESVEPDVQAILTRIQTTGEIPAGVEYIPADTKFSYLTNGYAAKSVLRSIRF